MELSKIETWHKVNNAAKVAALVAAYQRGDKVPTVVVLDLPGQYATALSGVHRMAALRQIHGDDCDVYDLPDGLVSVYDVVEMCDGESVDWDIVGRAFPPSGDAADVIREILPLITDAADNAALTDQL